jgi:hypothetical protein
MPSYDRVLRLTFEYTPKFVNAVPIVAGWGRELRNGCGGACALEPRGGRVVIMDWLSSSSARPPKTLRPSPAAPKSPPPAGAVLHCPTYFVRVSSVGHTAAQTKTTCEKAECSKATNVSWT